MGKGCVPYINPYANCRPPCPPKSIVPRFIINPSLFSGSRNDSGYSSASVTQAMRYSRSANPVLTSNKRITVFLPPPPQVRLPLSNPLP